ncbi:hypothetical protein BDZ91DRAFT_730814 [Kalaharituber pfeilii]|nr:hypothetical protein BDZ91DRAFT_730814 [Kalaharituber pfeilii]
MHPFLFYFCCGLFLFCLFYLSIYSFSMCGYLHPYPKTKEKSFTKKHGIHHITKRSGCTFGPFFF